MSFFDVIRYTISTFHGTGHLCVIDIQKPKYNGKIKNIYRVFKDRDGLDESGRGLVVKVLKHIPNVEKAYITSRGNIKVFLSTNPFNPQYKYRNIKKMVEKAVSKAYNEEIEPAVKGLNESLTDTEMNAGPIAQ